jgi:hypothetical protein
MSAVTLFLVGTAVTTKAQDVTLPAPTYQYTFDGGDASQSTIDWDGSTVIDNLNSISSNKNPIKKYMNEYADRDGDILFIHDSNLFLNKTDDESRYLRIGTTNQVEASDSVINLSKYKAISASYWFYRVNTSPRYDTQAIFIRDFGDGFLSQSLANNFVNTQVNFAKVGEDPTKWSAATGLLRIQTPFKVGEWHFYTVVYDMSGTSPRATSYLDGQFVNEVTDATLSCNVSIKAATVHLRFGGGTKVSSTSYQSAHPEGYNVDIDNFCFWKDVVLNDDQVLELYNQQLKSQIFTTNVKNITKASENTDVYSIQGVKVRSDVNSGRALDGLNKGVYIVNGKKIMK